MRRSRNSPLIKKCEGICRIDFRARQFIADQIILLKNDERFFSHAFSEALRGAPSHRTPDWQRVARKL